MFRTRTTVGRAEASPQLGRCISPQISRGALSVTQRVRRWRNPVGTHNTRWPLGAAGCGNNYCAHRRLSRGRLFGGAAASEYYSEQLHAWGRGPSYCSQTAGLGVARPCCSGPMPTRSHPPEECSGHQIRCKVRSLLPRSHPLLRFSRNPKVPHISSEITRQRAGAAG